MVTQGLRAAAQLVPAERSPRMPLLELPCHAVPDQHSGGRAAAATRRSTVAAADVSLMQCISRHRRKMAQAPESPSMYGTSW